jgi:antitoxin component HigA of HigAB toxin-antitoxin module
MKGAKLPIQFTQLPKDYAGLCRMLMPRPIRDKVDLENVTGMTDAMAGYKLTSDQEDYFDLLCRLVQDYESEQGGVSAPGVTGLEALRHLLDEHGMSAADHSRLLGAHRTLGAMILRGERKLTVEHMRMLCAHFSVSADLFL